MCSCRDDRASRGWYPHNGHCASPSRHPPRPADGRGGRGRWSRSAGRAARPRRAPAGPPDAPRPLPGSKAPLGRQAPRFEENVLISRGNAALRRGALSLVSRCAARTCARPRPALPTRGRGQAHPCAGGQAWWCEGAGGACVCTCRCAISDGDAYRVERTAQPPARGYRSPILFPPSSSRKTPTGSCSSGAPEIPCPAPAAFSRGDFFPVLPAGSGLCGGAPAPRRPTRGSGRPGRAAGLPARCRAPCALPAPARRRAHRLLL